MSAGPWAVTDARAAAFLAGRFPDGVAGVARIGRGEWSKAYAFRRAGREYVVRFSALDEDFAKDRLAARHATVDLPIPRVLEAGEALGGFYAISERVLGGYLDDLDAGQLRRALPSLFAALDAARLADVAASAGYGGWGPDGAAPHPTWRAALLDVAVDRPEHRTHGWRARLEASPTGAEPFDEAVERLRDLVAPVPEVRHLVHSDLLNYNVLVAGGRVAAVLDWGCSLYGDFLYDIAWLTFWAPWYPAWRGVDFAREAARHYESIELDVPHFAERLRCCEVQIGLGAQAYNAYKGRWPELAACAAQTLAIARRGEPDR